MENKSHALAAGAFVLLVVALLVGLAWWLTRDAGVKRLYEVSTREAVTGLQPQAPVKYRGIAVGKVIDIGWDRAQPGHVLLKLSVNDDAPIGPTTFATLGYQGVTGLAFVELDDDKANRALPPGPDGTPRVPLRASLISRLTDRGGALLGELEETARRVNALLGPEQQKLYAGTVRNFSDAAAGVARLTATLDQTIVQRVDPVLAAVPEIVTRTQKTLSTLDQASGELTAAAGEFRQTARQINRPGGTLDRLGDSADALAVSARALNGSTLPRMERAAEEVSRSARQFGRVSGRLADNPQAMIYGTGPIPPGPGEAGFQAAGGRP